MTQSREVHLVNRPDATPLPSDFQVVTVDVPAPGAGEVQVRNSWMSVDPYMRGRMRDVKSYSAPFTLNAAMTGGAVGEVVISNDPTLQVGDLVQSMNGWREVFNAPAATVQKVSATIPAQAYLGVAGMPGLTAYVGLQSRGMPMAVADDPPVRPFLDAGQRLFETRMGQLNLSCAQCHDRLAGQRLAGSTIPQAHPNGYPLYRLEWQGMGSLYRRLRNCLTGVRAEPFPPDSPEVVALSLYLAWRANGLKVETPAVRP